MALGPWECDDEYEELVPAVLCTSFEKGHGLGATTLASFHQFALTDILGGEEAAIRAAGRLLGVRGAVIPVTTEKSYMATYDDGVQLVGEHGVIDEPDEDRARHKIIALQRSLPTPPLAKRPGGLLQADLIVIGPGDLYQRTGKLCRGRECPRVRHATAKLVYTQTLATKVKGRQQVWD